MSRSFFESLDDLPERTRGYRVETRALLLRTFKSQDDRMRLITPWICTEWLLRAGKGFDGNAKDGYKASD